MLPIVLRPGVILICCVALWPFHVESCLALCSHVVVFQFCLALWSPRLGKRELVYVLLMLLFVYFAYIKFCPFSLALGARGWLRLVFVALLWTFLLTLLARKAYVKKKLYYYSELVVNPAFQYSGDISKGVSPDGNDRKKQTSLA